MRTTVNLDDDVYQAVTSLSQSSGLSFGKVLSKVVREGLKPKPTKKTKNGFPTFDVPPGTPMIPADLVQRVWEEEGQI